MRIKLSAKAQLLNDFRELQTNLQKVTCPLHCLRECITTPSNRERSGRHVHFPPQHQLRNAVTATLVTFGTSAFKVIKSIAAVIIIPSIHLCWSLVYETTSVDTADAYLNAAVRGAMEKAIPRGYSRKSKFPLWFSHTLRHYIATKNYFHRRLRNKPSDYFYN
jgi:hypothetical protein